MIYFVIMVVTVLAFLVGVIAINRMDDPSGDNKIGFGFFLWIVTTVIVVIDGSLWLSSIVFDNPIYGIVIAAGVCALLRWKHKI